MTRRAPLQALLVRESAHAMAAASAARAVWQRCVRELTGPCRRGASSAAGAAAVAAAKATASSPRSFPFRDSVGAVPEHANSLSSFSWGREGGPAVSPGATRAVCARSRSRLQCSVRSLAAAGSSISSESLVSLEHFYRPYAMQFSTGSAEEQNASESVPTETLTSAGTDVAAADSSSTELEFAPENESVPSTPLVQAIQSQEAVAAEDVAAPSSPDQQLRDLFSETKAPAALTGQSDSQRVVHPGRVYVGGLPFGMKGDDLRNGLRELCGKYGIVLDVSLAQHRHQSQKSIAAGKHRGFAFVTMETPEQAEETINKLNGTMVWGRALMVSYGLKRVEPDPSEQLESTANTVTRCKVFVGNLHEGTSHVDLLTRFQQYGTVVDVKLITELHSNRSRGFGFVTFAEEGQAVKAVLDTDGSILDGSAIRVNIAKYPQGY